MPKKFPSISRDGIKGLQLRHCGKLNSTYHGKLRCRSTRAAIHERYIYIGRKKYLVYCGSYIFEGSIAAVHEILFSSSCTVAAAVGIDAPQFDSFFTVPNFKQYRDNFIVSYIFLKNLSNGMLPHPLGGEVIFSLQHFIAASLNLMPCLSS